MVTHTLHLPGHLDSYDPSELMDEYYQEFGEGVSVYDDEVVDGETLDELETVELDEWVRENES